MSKPQIRRIYTQDVINGDGDVDAERLLYPLNLFLESTYNILNNNVSFTDNVKSQIFETSFTTQSTYSSGDFNPIEFNTTINKRPIGVIPIQILVFDDITQVIKNAVQIHWREKSNNKISIGYVTGLDDDTKYFLRLLVI